MLREPWDEDEDDAATIAAEGAASASSLRKEERRAEKDAKARAEAEAEAAEHDDTDTNLPLPPLDQISDNEKPESLRELCDRWVFVTGMERFLNRLDPTTQWKAGQFDSEFNYLVKTKSVARQLFAGKHLLRRYRRPIFRPGGAETAGKEYNLYRPSLIVPAEGDTTLWNKHLDFLFRPAERDLVLNWIAWVLQNPDKRPCVALLILGRVTGTGKSFLARVLEQIIGETNTQRPKNSSLKGDFNPWAALCRLAIIEELNQIGKREVTHELRDMITEPTIEVNPKGINPYKIANYIAMIGISNEPDALPIQPGDRRWQVVETHVTQEQKDKVEAEGYFAEIMPKVDRDAPGGIDRKFCAAVAYELLQRDVSAFTPGSAKATDAKSTMIALNESELETWLNNNVGNPPLTRNFVNIQDDVIEAVPPRILAKTYKAESTTVKWLRANLDGVPLKRNINVDGKVCKLWAINDAGREAKAELAKGVPSDCLLMANDRSVGKECADERKEQNRKADGSAAKDFGNE